MPRIDVTIQQFNTGAHAGKYAAHFTSERAKEVIDRLCQVENYIIAGVQTNIPKVERFCTAHHLNYELIILN